MATANRQIGKRGLALIKHFEGCYLEAYRDAVGVLTIGYGHTGLSHNDGTVFKGRVVTPQDAQNLLSHDMRHFSARVEKLVRVPLNQDQFDALVSFDFNTGALHKSTLLRKLNNSDYEGAAQEFLKWDKAGGKTLAGLTRRRKCEAALFKGKTLYLSI
jgi:lysozyme